MQISPSTEADRAAEQAAELAAELYLVPPAVFVTTRDQVARQASQAGRPDLAARLRELRRPTQSAWLVNLLVRHEPAGMAQLRALGRQLRAAQTALDGDELRRLSERRRALVGELTELARQRAAEVGVRVTERALTEVEATLSAALVDLAAACAAMSGRLVRPMAHNGFGPRPQLPDELPRQPRDGDDWAFWPAQPQIPTDVAIEEELAAYQDEEDAPRRRHLSLVPPLREPEPADPAAEALAAAELAAQVAREELSWFDQYRIVARSEQVAAENRLREAREKAARTPRAEQVSLFDPED